MVGKFSKALRLGLLATASLAAMTAPAFAAPIVAAVATLGSMFLGGGFLGAVARVGIGLAVNYGLSLLSGAISGKPKGVGGSSASVQIGSEVPRQIIFGRGLTSGRLTYIKGVGKKNTAIHAVYAICDWECDSLEKVWVAGVERALTSVSVVGTEHVRYTVDGFNGKLIVKFFRGTATQTADTELITASSDTDGFSLGAWTSAHDGQGVCYVSVKYIYDEDYLPSLPQMQFQIKGAKLYDWRLDSTNGGSGSHRWNDPTTWAWSGNPAVCDYNFRRGFFRGDHRILGMGVPSSDLLHSLYTAAANICDESVTEGGGSETRYLCGVIVNDDAEFRVAIDAFRVAMAGDVVERAGQFGVIAGASYAPVMTLTDDDMRADAPSSFSRKGSRSELYNAVTISYLNPVLKWDSDGLTPLTDAGWEAEDGDERLTMEVDLPSVYKPYQARRIGTIVHNQSRRQAMHTGVYPASFSALEPGDWVTKEFNRDGFDNLSMKVISVREVEPEWYQITLREVHQDDFDAPGGTIPTTTPPVITGHQKGPGTPGTPVLTEVVTVNPDGTIMSTVKVTFTAATTAVSYSVGVQEGSADEVERTVTNLRYAFKAVIGTLYTVRVRAVDSDGRSGTWTATATITPSGDVTAPGAPSGLTVTPLVYGFLLSWTNPAGVTDLAGIEIYESSSSTFASAVLLATVPSAAAMYFRDGLPVLATRYYWIKAKDRTGNVSARHPSGDPGTSGTTIDIDGGVDIRQTSILPSRVVIPGHENLVRDPDYADTAYWTSGGTGFTISTDATPLAALNAVRMAKSANGNGTTSQSAGNWTVSTSNPIAVVPGGRYIMMVPTYLTSGFTGRANIEIFWFKADGTTAAATASNTLTGTDYRTVAAGTAITSSFDSGVTASALTAPADAVKARIRFQVQWSTTLNNAGNFYFGRLLFRELNSASLTVDGTVTATKLSVSTLSAITGNVGTLTAGLIRSGASGMTMDLDNNRIRSGNFVDGETGFQLDGASGSVKAYSGEFAGGTSSKYPFELSFGAVQDNVLTDEGLASVDLPASFSGAAWADLSGTAKRTPTSIEYDLTVTYGDVPSHIQGSYPRGNGIGWAPTFVLHRDDEVIGGSSRSMRGIAVTAAGVIQEWTCETSIAGSLGSFNWTKADIASFINSIEMDPLFTGSYASTAIHYWKDVLIKGPRRIRVPNTVTVSGTPTAVTKMTVWMWGAAGQKGWDDDPAAGIKGGPGGFVKFTHAVSPGEMLTLLSGGYDGQGFGGASFPGGTGNSALSQRRFYNQGGGASFLWRGKMLRANLLGVAGGGGSGQGERGGPGGAAASGGNGSSSTLMDRCLGLATFDSADGHFGYGSGGGGYEGGGIMSLSSTDRPGKGGTNYIIGTATSTTNSASAVDGNGCATTDTPPGTSETPYTASGTNDLGRADVGACSGSHGKAGPGMIAIQWLTT